MVNFCWFFFKWGTILAVCVALFAAGYLYLYLDDEVRKGVEQILAKHYTHLDVHVKSARLVKGQGIEIRGLTISELNSNGPGEPLLEIDEIFLACQADLQELAQGKPEITQTIVRRPTIRAILDSQGKWNLNTLFPPPQLSDRSPPTSIHNATIIVTDARREQVKHFILRDIDLDLKPLDPPQAPGALNASNPPGRPPLQITGSLASRFAESATFQGVIHPETGQYNLSGKISRLEINPKLLSMLPPNLLSPTPSNPAQHFAPAAAAADKKKRELAAQLRAVIDTFHARTDISFHVSHEPAVSKNVRFVVDGQISDGRLRESHLPHPITDLSAKFHVSNDGVVINDLECMSGVTSIKASGQKKGFGPNDPLVLTTRIDHVQLTRDLCENLTQEMREVWRKYQPTGDISLEGTVRLENGKMIPNMMITCHKLSMLCEKFPYPVINTTGTIRREPDRLVINLVAKAGGRPLHIDADWQTPGPEATGWVTVRGANFTVDDKALSALGSLGKAQQIVRSLHPSGMVNIYWKGWRENPKIETLRSHIVLEIQDGAIQYDLFQYPLSEIHGRAESIDNVWTFRDLRGVNDTGVVTCQGSLTPQAPGVNRLELAFTGDNIRLDNELRDALPPGAKTAWNSLRPAGHINMTANVVYVSGQGPPDVRLSVTPIASTESTGGETASIRPIEFPCRFDRLEGRVDYHNGHAEWKQIRARHENKVITMNGGSCDHRLDGSWSLRFLGLEAEQLHVRRDPELIAALPKSLRDVLVELDPTGAFNLQGNIGLDGAPNTPTRAGWDIALQTHACDLNCGVELKNASGRVQLRGKYDGQRFECWGELGIDSVNWLDTQFTQVSGPFFVDNQVVYLGNWATRVAGREERHITGALYGGKLTGDGKVRLSKIPQYDLAATLEGGDLKRLAQESIQGPTEMTGRITAKINVQGVGESLDSLKGQGQVQITNATIYELPVLVSVLSLLRAEAPGTTAFKRSDMTFQIQGPRLRFSQLDLVGDAISLYGEGEVDFDQRANLTFYSVVGRNDIDLPVLRQLIGSVSQQFMQIRVNGNLNDPSGPQITNQLFPMLQEAIQQIQPEATAPNQQRLLTAPGRLLESAGLPARNKK